MSWIVKDFTGNIIGTIEYVKEGVGLRAIGGGIGLVITLFAMVTILPIGCCLLAFVGWWFLFKSMRKRPDIGKTLLGIIAMISTFIIVVLSILAFGTSYIAHSEPEFILVLVLYGIGLVYLYFVGLGLGIYYLGNKHKKVN